MDLFFILKIINISAIVITCLIVLMDNNKPPEVTFSWLIIIALFQFPGILLYILTGINWKSSKIVKHLPEETFRDQLDTVIQEQKKLTSGLRTQNEETSDMAKAMSLLLNCSNAIITSNNSIKLHHKGRDMFSDLFHDLSRATESIHMEFFIWRSDRIGEKIKDILIEKAQKGVEVRLIFDGVGSFNRIKLKYKTDLKKAGVEFVYFLDPLAAALKFLKFNYCNHRKVVVIDGKIGYTGGMNIGEEYITGGKEFPSWRDTHLRVEGGSVHLLQALFLVDWYNSTNELVTESRYFPDFPVTEGSPVQIAVSGPDSKWSTIHQLYFSMITNANSRIYIQSPYFIPDNSILKALETAALSGVEVHLMMTGLPDKRLPFWTAQTYFDNLLSAGVKIYLYNQGFMHSKVVIVDDMISTVGTCNMDVRSFHINYEVNAVIYDENISQQLKDQFQRDTEKCLQVTKRMQKEKKIYYRFRDSLCRLFAPIL